MTRGQFGQHFFSLSTLALKTVIMKIVTVFQKCSKFELNLITVKNVHSHLKLYNTSFKKDSEKECEPFVNLFEKSSNFLRIDIILLTQINSSF